MSDGLSRQELHFNGDLFEIMLQDPLENTRKHQRVVDLVTEIASTACVNECSSLNCLIGQNLRRRIGQSKNYRLLVHGFNPFFLQNVAH